MILNAPWMTTGLGLRARKLQVAIVAGEALVVSAAGLIVGLIERSALWGIIAALGVALLGTLIGSLALAIGLHCRHKQNQGRRPPG
jgi:hypothetical protein